MVTVFKQYFHSYGYSNNTLKIIKNHLQCRYNKYATQKYFDKGNRPITFSIIKMKKCCKNVDTVFHLFSL